MADLITRSGKGDLLSATDHDDNLETLATLHQGATEPTNTYPSMLWADTSTTLLKMRDTTNTSWIVLGDLNTSGAFASSNSMEELVDDTTPQLGGDLSTNGNDINFGDNDKAVFGAGSDLQIYHDGSNSRIKDTGTGALVLQTNQVNILSTTGEQVALFNENSNVKLYYDNAEKLATTSTGIDVTGTATMDGLTVDGGAGSALVTTLKGGTSSQLIIQGDADNIGDTGELDAKLTFATDGSTSGWDIASLNGSGFSTLQFLQNNKKYLNISSGGDISFYEDTGTTAKFFWDASAESLGIGTSSPAQLAHLYESTADTGAFLQVQESGGQNAYFGVNTSGGSIQVSGANPLQIATNGTERMRIDSSGNLLVGTTDTFVADNTSGNGLSYRAGAGDLGVAASNTPALYVNRMGSDGAIAEFRKDGTTVGSIGSHNNGTYVYIGAGDTGLVFAPNIDAIIPYNTSINNYRDNAIDLGTSFYRFQDIYASNGTIQTSDFNEKQDIDVLSDAEMRVAQVCKGLLRKFRWKDAVTEKGDDARIHFGIIAQDLKAAFEAEGLDAGRYGMFTSDTWWEHDVQVPAEEATYDEDGNVLTEAKEAYTRTYTYTTAEEAPEGAIERTRMGVRYPELLAFIIAAI